MRLALISLLLVVLSACGGSSDGAPKDTKPSEASTSEADALDATCAKLGRTWAVAADGLHSSLTLAAMGNVDTATAAMSAATDEMKIEQCEGEIVDQALMGNYEAALAAAEAQINCSGNAEIVVCPAGDMWRSNGEPIVAKVEELSAR